MKVAVACRIEHTVSAALAHRREVGCGNCQEIEHICHRCTVEVTVGLHAHVVSDDRVVDGRGQLDRRHLKGVGHGVAHGSVNLRGAPQRIGILDALDGTLPTGLDEVGPLQQGEDVGS